MDYLIVKWLHVMSSTFLFGTGVGSAFYLLFVVLRGDLRAIAEVSRLVVVADVLFTATTAVIQPVTGLYLVHRLHLGFEPRWIWGSLVLYVVAIGCWLPVVWIQIRLRDLAGESLRQGTTLGISFHRLFRAWILLGIPALLAFLVIFWMMVAKPH